MPGPGCTTLPTRNVGGLSPKTELRRSRANPSAYLAHNPDATHVELTAGMRELVLVRRALFLALWSSLRCNRGWWVGHKNRLAPALSLEIPRLPPPDSPSWSCTVGDHEDPPSTTPDHLPNPSDRPHPIPHPHPCQNETLEENAAYRLRRVVHGGCLVQPYHHRRHHQLPLHPRMTHLIDGCSPSSRGSWHSSRSWRHRSRLHLCRAALCGRSPMRGQQHRLGCGWSRRSARCSPTRLIKF